MVSHSAMNNGACSTRESDNSAGVTGLPPDEPSWRALLRVPPDFCLPIIPIALRSLLPPQVRTHQRARYWTPKIIEPGKFPRRFPNRWRLSGVPRARPCRRWRSARPCRKGLPTGRTARERCLRPPSCPRSSRAHLRGRPARAASHNRAPAPDRAVRVRRPTASGPAQPPPASAPPARRPGARGRAGVPPESAEAA